ncbi:PREDICTED: tetratricopeptide repeat protein 29 isoform X1 [Poecilia mexicana]|uniref:tetratricopeptide repeat protein 29 isoform X1 n=2 Tax=Poecilia formosa TaxID=48698 RepID=UPI000443C930|nr:PREDICTED: tetratricopeptide repeat protein 29 isoform X1 [Poecilia formosa]XP_014860786.1 PREDICTED: tetratricopeptide repeat protein 29 isoform X1 [Poecilia mexicana]XP_014860787.1 PREDICTED: tetratricopeptide repeat protein 29 isoform X1 [Poecilia mexicana]XP_014860789.1 PREDICTED: tetratricopeptide repeat protein 29 isoform X1 [Poecilia mexicana]XP_016537117.1 PREDICTED: tetratricopeptide repeat protein 29 isoform X1 [Poecilia formosa]XP_016537118.1 PREDICTED: tetratricopeptide repeat p
METFRNRKVSESSILSRKEIALFRNTPKQYMCVEMLQDGYHRSFSELFTLLSFDLEQRANAPPRSPRLQEPSLGEQREKLETIRLHLCRAEKAERDGSWTIVCEERLHLGRYFTHPMDIWLSFHFYHSCADRVFGGRSKSATEARFHLAELYRQQGDLVEARDHAERALKQAEDGGWLDSEGQPLRLWGCRELGEIYSLLGEAYLAAQEYDTATMLLQLGSKMAIEGGDKSVEAESFFREGMGLQSSGDHQAAMKLFNTCVELFGYLQDVKGLVKSYKAIAKSLESEGNIEECIKMLEKAADLCHSSDLQERLADISLTLGCIYSDVNRPLKSCEYFLQSYKAACTAREVVLQHKAQVKLGHTSAHSLIKSYNSEMETPSLTSVKRLVDWKETRGHQDFC